MKRFAIRTVKQGRVRINGKDYTPDKRYMPYDGRLDGQRFAFGLYDYIGSGEDFVNLWGTEAEYRTQDPKPSEGPQVVDGGYPWAWWYA